MKVNPQKEHFSIQNCFNKAVEIVSASLKNNDINLDITKSKGELFIDGIMNELTQVLSIFLITQKIF